MFILALTWLIFGKVYNSLGNNDDLTKLTAIILMPTKFKFENVYYSLENNKSFYKNDENSLRFKGNSRESLDENHEKEAQQQKTRPWSWCSRWGILYKSCWNVHKSQAKTSGRGQPGSTVIILKKY